MRIFGFHPQTFFTALLVGLVLIAALWLDLSQRGMIWEFLWNTTGETQPAAQLLAASQLVATQTRLQPDTAPHTNIQHLPENPFGINTFLDQEVEPEKRERQMQMISEAGFGWIRQEFPWSEIEVHGRGDFMDRRNESTIGVISSWDKYDNIVALSETYEVEIIARLSAPPQWALPANASWPFGPPQDMQDFVNYAVAVAERYRGQLRYFQIWNEPNLGAEWGYQQIDPAGYTDMLCRTYHALKAVDPEIVVLTAAIGPTIDLSGRDAYDLLYLQRLYDLGAGECFDILSAQGYGLFSGPTDRRMRTVTMNFARHQWLRDLMVTNGDEHKPIWISEAGWNPVPNDPRLIGLETYGVVSMEEAAAWVPIAYERSLSEWPYIGTISYWFMKRANDAEIGQSWYYFRLVNPDFTPTPIYDRFKTMIQSGEWQTWRGEKSWTTRTREQLPILLIGIWAVIFAVIVLSQAVMERLFRR